MLGQEQQLEQLEVVEGCEEGGATMPVVHSTCSKMP
jgi:hypothetical protein